jgi:uncharacterized protein (DUF58 family)
LEAVTFLRRVLRRLVWFPADVVEFVIGHHSLVFVVGAFIVVAVMAGISGHWLFYRGAYLIGGLIALCFAWTRVMSRGLEVEVERATERLQAGQETETRLRFKNRSAWTKVWLEVEDETDIPGRAPKTVLTLPAKAVRNWKVSTRCRRRGIYSLGPVKVTTGDPFGLFKASRRFGDSQRVLVLPAAEELPFFWAPVAQLPGEGTVSKRTHYVTPNASGVREYYPGDSYNRIHWKSTARRGRLMAKTFEMDPSSNVWLVLDLAEDVQAGSGDESTEEYGVRVATSLAYHFLQANRMVGLMMDGAERTVYEPSRGSQQYMRILESLAVARATGSTPLESLLAEEGRHLGRHSTVIVVTPSIDERWTAALSLLLQQGARGAVVLLDAESFRDNGTGGSGANAVTSLAATNVLVYEVRAGSELSLMLGPAGVVTAGMPQVQRAAPAGVR